MGAPWWPGMVVLGLRSAVAVVPKFEAIPGHHAEIRYFFHDLGLQSCCGMVEIHPNQERLGPFGRFSPD